MELIADGKHLPPPLLKLVYKCKGPRADPALCSDALRPAGMPEGEYYLGLRGGAEDPGKRRRRLTGDIGYGSVVTGIRLVRNMVELAGVPLRKRSDDDGNTRADPPVGPFLGSLDQG